MLPRSPHQPDESIDPRALGAVADLARLAHHELRSPLGLIVTVVQQALTNCDDEQLRAQLNVIGRSAQHALLTADAIVGSARPLETSESTDLRDLVCQLVVDHQHSADVRLHLRGGGAWAVRAPGTVVQMIVQSILANAISHRDTRSPIDVTLTQEAGQVVLQFANAVRDDAHHAGAGLGNSFVSRLAESLGGKVAREVHDGTYLVTLSLPSSGQPHPG